jgi:hypothetical protein
MRCCDLSVREGAQMVLFLFGNCSFLVQELVSTIGIAFVEFSLMTVHVCELLIAAG